MKRFLICICLMSTLLSPKSGSSYMPDYTHPLINKYALAESNTDKYLVDQLGIANGNNQIFNKKTAFEWMQLGGTDEDNNIRGFYHFHDPTQSWDYAGILRVGFSALQWAQDQTVGPPPSCEGLSALGIGIPCPQPLPSSNPEWSWPAARNYFYQALTSTVSTTDRNISFGKTFYTLGRIMHLLADAAVPEHARNDSHRLGSQFTYQLSALGSDVGNESPWTGSRYEIWVEDNTAIAESAPSSLITTFIQDNYMLSPVDYSVITAQSNVPGYIPISNFWDTTFAPDQVSNGLIDNIIAGDGSMAGLSEYTNHNFLSPSTIFTRNTFFTNYKYPVNPQLNPGNIKILHDIDENTEEKVYFGGMTSDGKSIDHLVSAGYLWANLERVSPGSMDSAKFVLDENCFYDYAKILVPKAVDYDTALLNYFFRGALAVSAPDGCFYGVIDGGATNGNVTQKQFTKIIANIGNISYIDNEQGNSSYVELMQSGTLLAVAKYKKRKNQPDSIVDPPTADTASSMEADFSYSVSEPYPLTQPDLDAINPSYKDFTFTFNANPIPAGITDLSLLVVFKGTLGNEQDNAIAVGFKDISEPTHINFWNTSDKVYNAGQVRDASPAEKVTINEYINLSCSGSTETYLSYQPMAPGQFGRVITLSDPGQTIDIDIFDDPNTYGWQSTSYRGIINQDGAYDTSVSTFRGKENHKKSSYVSPSTVYDDYYWTSVWPNATTDAIPVYNLDW
jgi:hypothetical protein